MWHRRTNRRMFTMAKIRNGSTYVARHLSANDYYSEGECIVGEWMGEGAKRLGLDGSIHPDDAAFENLRLNRHPDGSGKLTPRDGKDRVRFFDFQCSAQKSVSILAVTMGDGRLLAAHDAAARIAFRELEKFAARQANTAFHRANIRTANLTAAVFRHTASRALDPQVHTHFVVANATWDAGSKSWRALTEFEMVSAIRYAGKVYQNEVARSCLALGYEIERIHDGRGNTTGFEIAGVSAGLRERFSKRRAEVEAGIAAFRKENGRQPTTAEIHAITVESRNAKLTEITTPAVLAAQRAQLSAGELQELDGLKAGAVECATMEPNLLNREGRSLRAAVWQIYDRRSVVAGHEILAEALNQELGNIDLLALHAEAEQSDLIPLTEDTWVHGQFATEHGLMLEKSAVEFVDRTCGIFAPLGGQAIPLASHLSPEQAATATAVLESRDQVICLRGAAGVGKTTVLKEIHGALLKSGVQIYCCAPTSSAVDTLRRDGVPVTTLSDFLQNVVPRESDRLKGAVLICDEAGLTSNEQGAELLKVAERHQARVVFLGDARQHTAVEAGDFLRVIETHSKLQRVELTAIRRQEHKAYRGAVRCLAAGAARVGLERLDEMGWVRDAGPNYLRTAAEEFMRVSEDGRQLGRVLAVTPTWAEHEVLTAELRKQLKARGIVGAGEVITVHDPLKWTRAQTRSARNYTPGMVVTFNRTAGGHRSGESCEVVRVTRNGVFLRGAQDEEPLPLRSGSFSVSRTRSLEVANGDRLLIRANDRRSKLINGEILTVARIRMGIIEATDGRRIDTGRFRALTHGYAVTSHAAQSKTVDHVVVAAQRLNAKSAYVACSRGRLSCAVHTPDKTALMESLPHGNRAAVLDVAGRELWRTAIIDRRGAWARWVARRAEEFVDAACRVAGFAPKRSVQCEEVSPEMFGPRVRQDSQRTVQSHSFRL